MKNLKLNVVCREWRAVFVNDDGEPSTAVLMAESQSAARIAAEQLAEINHVVFVSVEPFG